MRFILLLGGFHLMIFLHELGHYLMAKFRGVSVSEFCVGLGPKLFSFNFRETHVTMRLIPFGGYINPVGGSDVVAANQTEAKKLMRKRRWLPREVWQREHWFSTQDPWEQALVSIGGVTFNFITTFLVLLLAITIFGYRTFAERPTVDKVWADPNFVKTGLLPGDSILTVNEHEVFEWEQLRRRLNEEKGKPIAMVVERDGVKTELNFTVPVVARDRSKPLEQVDVDALRISGRAVVVERESAGIGESVVLALGRMRDIFVREIELLPQILIGKADIFDLPAPYGIIDVFHHSGSEFYEHWLLYFAVLNATIGLSNLIPLLPLDGGHLVIEVLAMCGIRMHPIVRRAYSLIGILIVFGCMAVQLYNGYMGGLF